jgi:hypothetical protein
MLSRRMAEIVIWEEVIAMIGRTFTASWAKGKSKVAVNAAPSRKVLLSYHPRCQEELNLLLVRLVMPLLRRS